MRALRTVSKVRVDYPPPNAKPPQNGNRGDQIGWAAEQAEEVKAAINDLLKFYHSEATHPGATHIEFEVPEENLENLSGAVAATFDTCKARARLRSMCRAIGPSTRILW